MGAGDPETGPPVSLHAKGTNVATTRSAHTVWEGNLLEGNGVVSFDSSGAIDPQPVTWASRSQEANGKTSPEELIAAAHSSCFSMALSKGLADAGNPAQALDTSAEVELTPGTGITGITLTVRGQVDGMSEDDFVKIAEAAKSGCPVSQALTGTTITLDAALA
jgi:lipoyl-dependent peroxiredoxin